MKLVGDRVPQVVFADLQPACIERLAIRKFGQNIAFLAVMKYDLVSIDREQLTQ